MTSHPLRVQPCKALRCMTLDVARSEKAASVFTNYPGRAWGCSVKNLCPPAPQVEALQPEGNSVWEAIGNSSDEGRVVSHGEQTDHLLGLPTAPAAAAEVTRQDKVPCSASAMSCGSFLHTWQDPNLVCFRYVESRLCSMLVLFCNGPQVCPAGSCLQAPPCLPCRWTVYQAAP